MKITHIIKVASFLTLLSFFTASQAEEAPLSSSFNSAFSVNMQVSNKFTGIEACGLSMHGGMLLAVQKFHKSEGTDIQLGPAIGGTWENTFAGTTLVAVAGSHTGAGIGLGLRGGLGFGRITLGLNGQSILGTKHSHSEAMLIAGFQFQ